MVGAGPESPTLRSPGRRVALSVTLLFLGLLAIAQIELFATLRVSAASSLLVYLAAQAGILGLVLLVARAERRPLRDLGLVVRGPVVASLAFSALLVLLFVVVEIYPGFLFGFGRVPRSTVLAFGFTLFSAPLIAVSQEVAFRGYIFRSLSRAIPLSGALTVSAVLFALQTTNFNGLPSLGEVAGGEYLFTTTVANLVLGLVLGLYYYKARWSLLGPVAARAGMLWAVGLLPVAADFPGWETSFATILLAYGVLFVVIAFGLREPRLQAHHYLGTGFGPRRLRFLERARNRREVRSGVLTVAALAVVFVATTQVAPATLGASPPLVAIATGSMVPTLERGTLVVLEHASPGSITVGTIIAFHVSCLPAPTVHRVYRILQSGSSPVYQTKGDANPSPDPCTVPYADVLGRVVGIVPYLGLLVLDPLLDAAVVSLIIVAALLVPREERWRSR